MKKLMIYCGKIAFAIFFVSVAANAAAPVMVGADLAVKSRYVWRGMPFNEESVFWPDAWVNWNGFTVTIFGSMEMTDVYENAGKFTEVDYYLDYSRTFGNVSASVGYAHYEYPNTDFLITGELYASVSTDFKFFSGSLTAYYDIREAEGLYLQPSVSRTFSLAPVNPTLTLSLGYADKKHNAYYFWLEKSGLTDLTTSLSLSYSPPGPIGNYLTFSGDLNYAKILDSELADQFPDGDSNFWWGIGLSLFYEIGGQE